ncbi:AmmeMemoRadiSam system protein B [Harryflintia acetispora]|uniref:AmmeMemoRadiSam system protein B n=2 Tax=Harryflintia acetispora TaxID=1849041 RepID=A0A9X8UIN7_9FIRM|nr:AmmeMemoRadiSam system protein B [Harryflintia acetispora]
MCRLMSRRAPFLAWAALLWALLGASCAGGNPAQDAPAPSKQEAPAGAGASLGEQVTLGESGAAGGRLLTCDYYSEESFLRSVREAQPYEADGALIAGVVPHHLLAGRLIASFFATAVESGAEYESVVFVAPSHYPTAQRAVTNLSGWQTPFGVVENDRMITEALMGGTLAARADEDNMQLDHAVSGLIPYVKYYLPGAKVSAVLLQNRLEPERVEALAKRLLALSQEKKILLVCSVDFSHYLTPERAALHDERTRAALAAFDYQTIAGFDDSNMDSPQSITVFLRYLQGRGAGEVRFFDHSSADRILGLPPGDPAYREGVTTYFILGGVPG